MLRLRRGDGDPDARRGDPPGPRTRLDGHRRGHRLQHGVRQHLPVQPVPRAVDELAVRERAGGRPRRPGALGPGRPPGAAAVGHRRRRGDVRHRLPGPVADGRLRRRHQGPRARHAGLLEHRRPGVDGVVRRPGHQAVGVRQGDPRPARAAQGARPDPRRPRQRVRGADDAGPHQPLLSGGHGGERLPGTGGRHRLLALPARARDRRRRVDAPRPSWRSSRGRSRCSPTTRGAASGCPSAGPCRATRRSATTGRRGPTGASSTSWPSRAPRVGSPRTSPPTAPRARRSSPRRPIGSRTGTCSRSWPGCADAPGRRARPAQRCRSCHPR